MVRALSGSRPFATSRGVSSTCDPLGYDDFLRELKARIRNAQVKAAVAVNSELVLLYWRMGRDIRLRLATEGWGTQVIDRLSADLRASFPDMEGFTSDACSSAPRAAWSFT
jgi:hypothetical protein